MIAKDSTKGTREDGLHPSHGKLSLQLKRALQNDVVSAVNLQKANK